MKHTSSYRGVEGDVLGMELRSVNSAYCVSHDDSFSKKGSWVEAMQLDIMGEVVVPQKMVADHYARWKCQDMSL